MRDAQTAFDGAAQGALKAMSALASLPLFHQIAGTKVLVLGSGEAAEPKRRLVERAGAMIVADQSEALVQGVRIAFVALDDPAECEAAAADLKQAGLLVNVVDRPELCDFTTPSLLDRDPLLLAIGTGGASAGLAKHVRLRLERLLPQTLGDLAEGLRAVRPVLRKRLPDGADRRRVIDAALREGGALDALVEGSHAKVASWADGLAPADEGGTDDLAKRTTSPVAPMANEPEVLKPGTFAEFHLASPDPDDLTIRQARLLGEADRVLLDPPPGSEFPSAILARARADAQRLQWYSARDNRVPDAFSVVLHYRPAPNSLIRRFLRSMLAQDL